MNFRPNTPSKRVYFIGTVMILHFLTTAFNTHFTSKFMPLNEGSQISSVKDVVDRGIPLIVERFMNKTIHLALSLELGGTSGVKIRYMDEDYDRNQNHALVYHTVNPINVKVEKNDNDFSYKSFPMTNMSYPLVVRFPPHSPFVSDFKRMRSLLVEVGLPDYSSDSVPWMNNVKKVGKQTALQFKQFSVMVKAFLVGMAGSFVVFLCEVFHLKLGQFWRKVKGVKIPRKIKFGFLTQLTQRIRARNTTEIRV